MRPASPDGANYSPCRRRRHAPPVDNDGEWREDGFRKAASAAVQSGLQLYLKQINESPLLTADQEKELGRKIINENCPESRERMGRLLAREHPAEADVIVPIPDSGVAAAIGYAAESGIPYRHALIRNHYVGRTFIEPSQAIRDFGVKLKLNPVRHLLEGKRVVLVDDSIVRGTTSRKIVRMVRNAGAREVHMRISCPPTISHRCSRR